MANAYYIPVGPKNLSGLFPELDWDNIKSFSVSVTDGDSTIATTPVMKLDCCPEQYVRLQFVNSLGGCDFLSFLKPHVVHEDTAGEYQNALNYPLQKTDTGIERSNVKGNDTYEARYNCNEDDQKWLRELWDSSKILMAWEGTEGQEDDFIPVVKIAGKFDSLKNVEEFRYEFVIQFKLSNDYITQRN